jgi:hypothetical protein
MIKRNRLSALFSSAMLLCFPCVASATTVYPETGSVLVNEGKGFVGISGEYKVHPGAKIMAKKGGSAMISYGSGCTVRVTPGEVKVVEETSPCNGGVEGADASSGPSSTALAVGGGIALVGAGIAIGVNHDKPASP